MKKVMFQLQSRRARGGANVGGYLLEKKDLFDQKYIKNITNSNNILEFAEPRTYFRNIKQMTLEQFESYFTAEDIKKMQHLMTYNSGEYLKDNFFCKEILLKYGTNICPENKLTAKKIRKLEKGHIYKSEKGDINWLYLGNICIEQQVNNKKLEQVTGNCFINVKSIDCVEIGVQQFFKSLAITYHRESFIRQHFIKGVKSVIEDIAKIDNIDEILNNYKTIIIPKGYWDSCDKSIVTKVNFNN